MKGIHKLLTGEWVDPITRLPNQEFVKTYLKNLGKAMKNFMFCTSH